MKTKLVIYWLLIEVAFYGVFAFSRYSLNPSEWTEVNRSFFSIISITLFVYGIGLMLYLDSKKGGNG